MHVTSPEMWEWNVAITSESPLVPLLDAPQVPHPGITIILTVNAIDQFCGLLNFTYMEAQNANSFVGFTHVALRGGVCSLSDLRNVLVSRGTCTKEEGRGFRGQTLVHL